MNQPTQMQPQIILNPDNPIERGLIVDERRFVLAQRQAQAIASAGELIPKQYQNNIGATMIALNMANRMGCDALQIMQSLQVIHGKPSFSSKFLIAQINSSNVIDGFLEFEFVDDVEKTVSYSFNRWDNGNKKRFEGQETIVDRKCRAFGYRNDRLIVGPWVSLSMAITEGWYHKDGSKWQTMPELMLQYRAASFWAGVNAPQLSMGLQTVEELQDITEKDITPEPAPAASAQAILNQTATPKPAQPATTAATVEPEPESAPEPQPEPEPAPEIETPTSWPAKNAAGKWVDSVGAVYDANEHGWSTANDRPAVKANGTFRAKRQTAAEAKSQELAPGLEETRAPVFDDDIICPFNDEKVESLKAANTLLRAIETHIKDATDAKRLNDILDKMNLMGFDQDETDLANYWVKSTASEKGITL